MAWLQVVGTELDPDSADMGLLLQPCELVRDELVAGRLVEVLTDFPVPIRPFHIMYAPNRRMTHKLLSFIDFMVAVFGADAK